MKPQNELVVTMTVPAEVLARAEAAERAWIEAIRAVDPADDTAGGVGPHRRVARAAWERNACYEELARGVCGAVPVSTALFAAASVARRDADFWQRGVDMITARTRRCEMTVQAGEVR